MLCRASFRFLRAAGRHRDPVLSWFRHVSTFTVRCTSYLSGQKESVGIHQSYVKNPPILGCEEFGMIFSEMGGFTGHLISPVSETNHSSGSTAIGGSFPSLGN